MLITVICHQTYGTGVGSAGGGGRRKGGGGAREYVPPFFDWGGGAMVCLCPPFLFST